MSDFQKKIMKNQWQKEIYKHREYWGRIVAIADDKIIAVADDYDEIRELASKITNKFGCYAVPEDPHAIRILTFSLGFKTMKRKI